MKSDTKIIWFKAFHIKTLFGSKPLRIRFDEVDGFIKVYDGIRYLALFSLETHGTYNNIIR